LGKFNGEEKNEDEPEGIPISKWQSCEATDILEERLKKVEQPNANVNCYTVMTILSIGYVLII
jgi:hypothetical protein